VKAKIRNIGAKMRKATLSQKSEINSRKVWIFNSRFRFFYSFDSSDFSLFCPNKYARWKVEMATYGFH